jgi:hypothetical protein
MLLQHRLCNRVWRESTGNDCVEDLLGIDRMKIVEALDCVKTSIGHVLPLPVRMKTAISSSLKFDSFWADLMRRKHFDPVERATSDLFLRGGVRTPRNASVLTTALRFSTNC